jgi:hypothetical protein
MKKRLTKRKANNNVLLTNNTSILLVTGMLASYQVGSTICSCVCT